MSADGKSAAKVVWGFIGCFFFFASFLVWIFVGCFGFAGTHEGLLGGSMIYGLDAELNIALWLCVIPVIPVCFLYELIFGIAYIARSKDKKFKKGTGIFLLAVLLFVASPCIFWAIRYQALVIGNSASIRSYLKDKYGETAARQAKIRVDEFDTEDPSFLISTPILEKGKTFDLHYSSYKGGYGDNLDDYISKGIPGFREDFGKYLDEKYQMPSNMHIDAEFDGADLGDYHCGDDYTEFFPTARYRICFLYVDLDDADYDAFINTPIEICDEYNFLLENSPNRCLQVIFRIDGEDALKVQIDAPFYGNYYRATATYYACNSYPELSYLNGTYFVDTLGKTVVEIA